METQTLLRDDGRVVVLFLMCDPACSQAVSYVPSWLNELDGFLGAWPPFPELE